MEFGRAEKINFKRFQFESHGHKEPLADRDVSRPRGISTPEAALTRRRTTWEIHLGTTLRVRVEPPKRIQLSMYYR